MKKILIVLLTLGMLLSGCQQEVKTAHLPSDNQEITDKIQSMLEATPPPAAPTPALASASSPPPSAPTPTLAIEDIPIPELLDAASFIGRTVNDVLEEYASVATISEEWYNGSRYMLLSEPLRAALFFNPTDFDAILGTEEIVAIKPFFDTSVLSVCGMSRNITFEDLVQYIEEHPDAFSKTDIEYDGYDDEQSEYYNSINIYLPNIEILFEWSENALDQPSNSVLIRQARAVY